MISFEPNPTRNEASNPTPRQPLVKSLPTNPSQSKDKSALDLVVQKLEELAKKPAVPLPKSPSQLKVIKLRSTSSSSSSETDEKVSKVKETLKARKARYKLEAKKHPKEVSQPVSKAHKKAKPNKPQKCYGCGKRGHYKKGCEAKTSNPEPQVPSITQPLAQETSKPEEQQPKMDFEPIYDKPKKEVKIDDLQRETKETRSEIGALKQNLQAFQKTRSLESTSHQSNEESPSDDEDSQSVNPTADPIQEPSPDLLDRKSVV